MKAAPPVGTPVTLRESRVRLAVLTAGAVVFALAGLGIVAGGDRSAAAWATLLLSAGAAFVCGWGFVHRRVLRLDGDGFEATAGLPGRRSIRVRWRDVARFCEVAIPGETIVGFHLHRGAAPVTSRLRRLVENATMPDAPDGTLPTLYGGMSAAELIRYLERWRGRAAAGGGSE